MRGQPSHAEAFDLIPDSELAIGFESRYVRAGFRMDHDIGRVYRATSAATLAGGALAIGGALRRRGLRRHERWVAGTTGVAYMGVGVIGVWASPSHVALWFQRRPRRALLASIAPLALLASSGGTRSPLSRLATIGVGTAAGVRERSGDGQLQALLAGALWSATSYRAATKKSVAVRDGAMMTLGFVLASRLAASAAQVAYDSRNLFDQLVDFTYEREDLEPYVSNLREVLQRIRASILEAFDDEPRDGVSDATLLDEAISSLGRLEERLGVLEVAALSRIDLQRLVKNISPGWRPAGGRDTLTNTVAKDAHEMRMMLTQRIRVFTGLMPGAPPPLVLVDEDVEVRGLQRLALIGASVTAGATNAVRHAKDMTRLEVRLYRNGANLELEIVNDGTAQPSGANHARQRSGLVHLSRQIEGFGDLAPTFAPLADGGYRLHVTLPADSDASRVNFWTDEIREQIATGLAHGSVVAAAKSTLSALTARDGTQRAAGPGPGPGGAVRRLARIGQVGLPAVAELLAKRGLLRRGHADGEAIVLALAAVLNHCAARERSGLSSTWVSAFASRYAFNAPSEWRGARPRALAASVANGRSQQRAYALAGLNVAVLLAAWPRLRGSSWENDIASMTIGPALMGMIVNPAQPRTRRLDEAINEQLAEVEALYDLADSFHADHPAPPKIRELAELVGDERLSERLRVGLQELQDAEIALLHAPAAEHEPIRAECPLERLGERIEEGSPRLADSRAVRAIWPDPKSYYKPSIGIPDEARLGEYLARALARRIWPARVRLDFDAPSVGFAPDSANHSAAFRRKAVAAMDIIGRELNRQFGRRWDGGWLLRQIDIRVSIVPYTGTVTCEMVPWSVEPGRWQQTGDAVRRRLGWVPYLRLPKDREKQVTELLRKVDASLARWDVRRDLVVDGEPLAVSRDSFDEPFPVRRGQVAIDLHPQRYSRERRDFARRARVAT
jgi:hypothetical protein